MQQAAAQLASRTPVDAHMETSLCSDSPSRRTLPRIGSEPADNPAPPPCVLPRKINAPICPEHAPGSVFTGSGPEAARRAVSRSIGFELTGVCQFASTVVC